MQQQVWRDLFNRRLCELKSNAINYLNPAHKSRDAWVRIASSVQSRGGRPLILECASCRDCTLEAMRTQVFANQCIDCTVVLFAHASDKYLPAKGRHRWRRAICLIATLRAQCGAWLVICRRAKRRRSIR